MIIYSVLVNRQVPLSGPMPLIVLSTIDLGQAVMLVQNIHTLGFPFDTEGDHVVLYGMEGGVPLPASVFYDTSRPPPHPVLYWRSKDKDLEWVDQWPTEEERLVCQRAVAKNFRGRITDEDEANNLVSD